jgi:hypothetical protein
LPPALDSLHHHLEPALAAFGKGVSAQALDHVALELGS